MDRFVLIAQAVSPGGSAEFDVKLYVCEKCGAIVAEDRRQAHREWHEHVAARATSEG
jgi:hypothetical protein